MKQDSIQDLKTFDNKIFETIEDFLNNKENFAVDSVLAINTKTKAISITSPAYCEGCDQYAINSLIRTDEQGNHEPDCDATYEVASKYYFVR